MDVSPDGQLVALAGDDGIRVWKRAHGMGLGLVGLRQCRSVRFLPGGGSLLAAFPGWVLHVRLSPFGAPLGGPGQPSEPVEQS